MLWWSSKHKGHPITKFLVTIIRSYFNSEKSRGGSLFMDCKTEKTWSELAHWLRREYMWTITRPFLKFWISKERCTTYLVNAVDLARARPARPTSQCLRHDADKTPHAAKCKLNLKYDLISVLQHALNAPRRTIYSWILLNCCFLHPFVVLFQERCIRFKDAVNAAETAWMRHGCGSVRPARPPPSHVSAPQTKTSPQRPSQQHAANSTSQHHEAALPSTATTPNWPSNGL
jgi:hypothetical protein